MRITVNENNDIQLEEVYSGVTLRTRHGETMGICMRDTGFEFNYNGQWYSAQNGHIAAIGGKSKVTGMKFNVDGGKP